MLSEGVQGYSTAATFDDEEAIENPVLQEDVSPRSKAERCLGYAFILAVVLLWSCSSFVVQMLEEEAIGSFFVTFFSTCMFALYLPLGFAYDRYKEKASLKALDSPPDTLDDLAETAFSMRYTAVASAKILPLWYAANVFYNWSLCRTSVASSTVLSSTSSVFTLLLGRCLGAERVDKKKILGVIVTLLGVLLVSSADKSSVAPSGSNSTSGCTIHGDYKGDILSLASAFFYGTYTIAIKVLFPGTKEVRVDYMFGFVGLYSVVLVTPVMLLTTTEISKLSLSVATVGLLLLNAMMSNVLSDYFWARAVLLTSPTLTTVGLSLTIPLSIVLDQIVNHTAMAFVSLVGALLIVSGFLTVAYSVEGS